MLSSKVRFVNRNIGNQPLLEITGNSIEHVLSSRYFQTYTYDGQFKVIVASNDAVKIQSKNDTGEDGMLIGWIKIVD